MEGSYLAKVAGDGGGLVVVWMRVGGGKVKVVASWRRKK